MTATQPPVNPGGSGKPGSDSFPIWGIVLIVLAIAVVLAIVVFALVITAQKRKKKAEKAKELAKKKLVAAKPTPDAEPPSVKSAGSRSGETIGIHHGVKVPSADHSVAVSLAGDVTKNPKKTLMNVKKKTAAAPASKSVGPSASPKVQSAVQTPSQKSIGSKSSVPSKSNVTAASPSVRNRNQSRSPPTRVAPRNRRRLPLCRVWERRENE